MNKLSAKISSLFLVSLLLWSSCSQQEGVPNYYQDNQRKTEIVNTNTLFTVQDLIKINQHLKKISSLDSSDLKKYDVYKDGKITQHDLDSLSNFIVGK